MSVTTRIRNLIGIPSKGIIEKGYGISKLITHKQTIEQIKEEEAKNKGKIEEEKLSKFLAGEKLVPHPANYSEYTLAYKSVPIIRNQIDVKTGFVLAGEQFVSSPNEKVAEYLTDFVQKKRFQRWLRPSVRQAQAYGWCMVEYMKGDKFTKKFIPWSPENIFIKLKKGQIDEFCQVHGTNKIVTRWKPKEVMFVALNNISDEIYGVSEIENQATVLKYYVANQKRQDTIISKKSNPQMHWKLGSPEHPSHPDDIDALSSDIETMDENTDWVTSHLAECDIKEMQGMDTMPIMDNYKEDLIFGGKVPAVLMGKANIPEGLAKAQLKSFKVSSVKDIQQAFADAIEETILRKALEKEMPALADEKFTFEWGKPDEEEEQKQVEVLSKFLDLRITASPEFKFAIEKKIAQILGIEMENQTPPAPNAKPEEEEKLKQLIKDKALAEKIANTKIPYPEIKTIEKHYEKTLWGIFRESRDRILKRILDKTMESLTKWEERDIKMFTDDEMEIVLKEIDDKMEKPLSDSYNKGVDEAGVQLNRNFLLSQYDQEALMAINELHYDLIKGVTGEIAKNLKVQLKLGIERGDSIPKIAKAVKEVFDVKKSRLEKIARTETLRAVNSGRLSGYKKADVERWEFLVTEDERLCPICEPLNGKTFPITDMTYKPPIHTSCRCTVIPLVE